MQALNDWPPPWPPPAPLSEPLQLSRGVVMTRIFKRTMILAMVGGMEVGRVVRPEGGLGSRMAIPLGAIAGFPLGVVAGCVLAVVGGVLLVPYRDPVVAITVVSGLASCLVMGYLSLALGGIGHGWSR